MNYFAWYSNHDRIQLYKENYAKRLSQARQLLEQPFSELINLPIQQFKKMVKWKIDFEEAKNEKIMNQMGIIKEKKLSARQ